MPAADTWKYVDNQLLVQTTGSYKRMNELFVDHCGKISGAVGGAPVFGTINTRNLPVKTLWTTAFARWEGADAVRAGASALLEVKFGEPFKVHPTTGSIMDGWLAMVQVFSPAGTPKRKTLLPEGNDGFHDGTYLERVNYWKGFLSRAPGQGATADLIDPLSIYVGELDAAFLALKDAEEEAGDSRTELEPLRVQCAWLMYRNLGLLMDWAAENSVQAANYFKLELIREHEEEETPPAPPIPPTP